MDETRFERLETKVDKIADVMVEVKVNTAENTASLQEHMKNNAELKAQTMILFEGIESIKQDTDNRLKPLETMLDRVKYTGVILGVLGGLILGAHELGLFRLLQAFLQG
jgi:hypothetical protein